MITLRTTTRGFTLIEILLSVGLFGVIMFSAVAFMHMLSDDHIKNEMVVATDQEAERVLQIISQTIRSASSITTPLSGSTSSTLTIQTSTPGTTTITLSSGIISITEGANPSIAITSDRIIVSNLVFANYGPSGSSGSIQFLFTLSTGDYQQTYSGTATPRK